MNVEEESLFIRTTETEWKLFIAFYILNVQKLATSGSYSVPRWKDTAGESIKYLKSFPGSEPEPMVDDGEEHTGQVASSSHLHTV